ncbi:MAG: PIN domain-containing protein [Candidatus Nanohaloarchaea archaeon]|nr:PIN domain-containing protein [Candidatus Nanohaloarchaea archaeon]
MILDTSVLVDIDRGKHLERLQNLEGQWHAISAATYMELATGKHRNDVPQEEFENVKTVLEIIPVSTGIADKAGQFLAQLLENGEPVGTNDLYVAATAAVHDQPVLTSDVDDFRRVPDIAVVDWREL